MNDNVMRVSDVHDQLHSLLGDFLRRLFSQMDMAAMDQLVEADVSLTQARLLLTLSFCDKSLPIGELAQALGLSVATTGRNVDQLVRLGLLERKESPQDRRVKLVSLSEAGAAMTDDHVAAKRDALRAFAAKVPAGNCELLIDALQPVLAGNYLQATKEGAIVDNP